MPATEVDARYVLGTGSRVGVGRLITLDGFDGTGKSTLTRMLVAALRGQGRRTLRVRTPTAAFRRTKMFTLLARKGRVDLVDPLALQVAHMSDRLQLMRRVVVPALAADADVIVDRYLASAYGALFRLNLLPAPWFHELASRLPTPDAAVYLHACFEAWSARMCARPPRERTMCTHEEFLRRRELGLAIAAANDMLPLDTSQLSPSACVAMVLRQLEST
jgi:dTMP kinase